MSDMYVVAERDGRRVGTVVDMGAEEPYHDGASPIVRLDVNGYVGRSAHQLTSLTSYRLPSGIEEAVAHWGERGRDMLDRHLAAFHGVTATEWWHSGDAWYVTMDPADWRAKVGAPAGSINMDEWRAYCRGEVYLVVEERRETWTSTTTGETRETWETVEAVGGFYGHEYAIAKAQEWAETWEVRA